MRHPTDPRQHNTARRLTDRRTTLKLLTAAPLGLATGAALLGTAQAQTAAPIAAMRAPAAAAPIEPEAGSWRTWVLSSSSELRLAPPPDADTTQAELDELRALADRRDGAALDRISYWDAGAPGYRWNERAVKHTQSKGAVGQRAQRMLALLNVAILDGTIAAWDTKYAYNRARPADAGGPAAAIATPNSPSYPDERAVAAGAAATVLGYVFPADADMFAQLAEEAARSRVEAGVAFPSDVTAGLALGREVGERVVARGRADGSDATWSGTVPVESGLWSGTNPVDPNTANWKPWTLTSGSQYRPGPPPALDSEQFARELDEIKTYPRTHLTNLIASYWEYFGGRAAFEYWHDQASRKIAEYRLDTNPPRAALVYALVHIASIDAMIVGWDAKYTYWYPRPQMVDPSVTTTFTAPNHPSYPSAHSFWSGAAGTMMGQLFPRDADYYDTLVKEIGESRIMAGIHYRSDCEVGLALGRQVAGTVWAHAQATTM